MCQKCNSREKLCFYIESDEQSDWKVKNVILICSECKGFSVGYSFDRTIPDGTKDVVGQRDGWECKNCGSGYGLCYDHIIPFSMGGASADADNIQLLCSDCNSSKHASFMY